MSTSTGHAVGDAVLPAALRLVGAVRAGDPVEITAAIGAAYAAPTATTGLLAWTHIEGARS